MLNIIINATKDNTIVRKSDVFGPNATWNEDEWLVLGFEDYTNLKLHEMDYYHLPEEIARIPDLYIQNILKVMASMPLQNILRFITV